MVLAVPTNLKSALKLPVDSYRNLPVDSVIRAGNCNTTVGTSKKKSRLSLTSQRVSVFYNSLTVFANKNDVCSYNTSILFLIVKFTAFGPLSVNSVI